MCDVRCAVCDVRVSTCPVVASTAPSLSNTAASRTLYCTLFPNACLTNAQPSTEVGSKRGLLSKPSYISQKAPAWASNLLQSMEFTSTTLEAVVTEMNALRARVDAHIDDTHRRLAALEARSGLPPHVVSGSPVLSSVQGGVFAGPSLALSQPALKGTAPVVGRGEGARDKRSRVYFGRGRRKRRQCFCDSCGSLLFFMNCAVGVWL